MINSYQQSKRLWSLSRMTLETKVLQALVIKLLVSLNISRESFPYMYDIDDCTYDQLETMVTNLSQYKKEIEVIS